MRGESDWKEGKGKGGREESKTETENMEEGGEFPGRKEKLE